MILMDSHTFENLTWIIKISTFPLHQVEKPEIVDRVQKPLRLAYKWSGILGNLRKVDQKHWIYMMFSHRDSML